MKEPNAQTVLDIKQRKRLLYLSAHRGIKENDVLLGRFAQAYLAELSPEQSRVYAEFLEESDWDILAWIMGGEENPKVYKEIIHMIKNTLDLTG